MIVSASRRTDLPGFYGEWLLNRVRAGHAVAVNPFNPRQRRRVPLDPGAVDAFVFWTRDPERLAQLAARLEDLGHRRFIAHVTLTGLARELEPGSPEPAAAVAGMKRLAERAGNPRRVIWRYDPILLGPRDRPQQHEERFAALARAVAGHAGRVVVSFLDLYRKTERRLRKAGYPYFPEEDPDQDFARRRLLASLSRTAAEHGLELQVCAEPAPYERVGAPAARCVDPALLGELFPDRGFPPGKDPGQRGHCGCAPSVDLGVPDTCPRGCVYCYATRTDRLGRERYQRHDPGGESLFEVAPAPKGNEVPRREEAEGRRENERENPRLPGL
jgi:hypothetical protein